MSVLLFQIVPGTSEVEMTYKFPNILIGLKEQKDPQRKDFRVSWQAL